MKVNVFGALVLIAEPFFSVNLVYNQTYNR